MREELQSILSLASRARDEGRRTEAINAYRRLLSLEPNLPDQWYNLALLLRNEARFDEALAAYDEALARGVEAPEEVHLNRSVILADHLRRETDAEAALEAAIRSKRDFVPAILNLGNLKEGRGDRRGAEDAYRKILPPADGPAGPYMEQRFVALARLVQVCEPQSLDDPTLKALAAAAATRLLISTETRATLNFALGRALDALQSYDAAFAAFAEANRNARKAGPAYDRRTIVDGVDRLIEAYEVAAPARKAKSVAPEPVFICGMFRSGSTLVEQVLAAHRQVSPGGELYLLNRIADVDLAPYPQSIRSRSEAQLARLADGYRADLVKLFPESAAPGSIVTDKRPDNFLRIGLVKQLFPAAKIVHTVRHPVDNCLSVYFEHIDQSIFGYSSDLEDCGHYYGEYRRMIAHWKKLYPGDILDFDYDRFVAEPKPALERLLAFLGLPYDARCLSFHELKNPVKTASYLQVRRPLYAGSSGRRRNYEKHLAPLASALAKAGVGAD